MQYTDGSLATSKVGPFSDEDILAEFRPDNEDEQEEDDKVEIDEECPKKPTASDVKHAIDVLISYSLFVDEGAEEIRSHAHQITVLTERIAPTISATGNDHFIFSASAVKIGKRTWLLL